MKYYSILFACTLLAACTSSPTSEKISIGTGKTSLDTVHATPQNSASTLNPTTTGSFNEYLNELTVQKLPLHFKTGDNFISDETTPKLYEKYKLTVANNSGGRIFTNDHYTLLLDLIAGDIIVPALVTYTNEGIKIDSLIFFDASYEGKNILSQETVLVDKDLVIHRYDSTFSWKKNKTETEIIDTKKLKHANTRTFTINADGKFVKQQ